MSAFCDAMRWYSVPAPFYVAGKFCENQLIPKACSLRASVRYAYQYLFISKKAMVLKDTVLTQ